MPNTTKHIFKLQKKKKKGFKKQRKNILKSKTDIYIYRKMKIQKDF